MRELNWDDIIIPGYHWEFDPVDEVWRDFETEDEVTEEIGALLFYIQSISLPKQSSESLKFLIDELKRTLSLKDLEIEKLRDQVDLLEEKLKSKELYFSNPRRNYNSYNEME
jgi:hypothetical protein